MYIYNNVFCLYFQCTAFDIRKSSGLRLFVMITTILLIYAMAQVNVVCIKRQLPGQFFMLFLSSADFFSKLTF